MKSYRARSPIVFYGYLFSAVFTTAMTVTGCSVAAVKSETSMVRTPPQDNSIEESSKGSEKRPKKPRGRFRAEIRAEIKALRSSLLMNVSDALPKSLPKKKVSIEPQKSIKSAGEAKTILIEQITKPTSEPSLVTDSLLQIETENTQSGSDGFIQINDLENSRLQLSQPSETPLIFDIPVTYNARVSHWIRYFQTTGRSTFRNWLQRSSRYMPLLQYELSKANMPLDLAYVVMIESGFRTNALSHAKAMGLWQFIPSTGQQYGLKIDWWIDERRDFVKSTRAAIAYMSDLFKQFDSWYLVAASYNMGENGVRRIIKRRRTNNFWDLAELNALPKETRDYVPKIIAATLIAKAPSLYGFRDLEYQMPLSFESIMVPGGTDLINLANYLGVSEKSLKELNPELIKGFIPRTIQEHKIRIPKGSSLTVARYIRVQAQGPTASN